MHCATEPWVPGKTAPKFWGCDRHHCTGLRTDRGCEGWGSAACRLHAEGLRDAAVSSEAVCSAEVCHLAGEWGCTAHWCTVQRSEAGGGELEKPADSAAGVELETASSFQWDGCCTLDPGCTHSGFATGPAGWLHLE